MILRYMSEYNRSKKKNQTLKENTEKHTGQNGETTYVIDIDKILRYLSPPPPQPPSPFC